jgi:hypothetical protein
MKKILGIFCCLLFICSISLFGAGRNPKKSESSSSSSSSSGSNYKNIQTKQDLIASMDKYKKANDKKKEKLFIELLIKLDYMKTVNVKGGNKDNGEMSLFDWFKSRLQALDKEDAKLFHKIIKHVVPSFSYSSQEGLKEWINSYKNLEQREFSEKDQKTRENKRLINDLLNNLETIKKDKGLFQWFLDQLQNNGLNDIYRDIKNR